MRPFFNARAKALLRRQNEANLYNTCDIFGPASGEMKAGGVRANEGAYALEAAQQPCRLAPMNLRMPMELVVSEQQYSQVKWLVFFPAGTIIGADRRLKVYGNTRGTRWTRWLEVIGAEQSDNEMYYRLVCADLRPELIPGED
jgi:hypothetical protein